MMTKQTSRQKRTISAMCGTTMDTSLSISSSKTSIASLAWSLKEQKPHTRTSEINRKGWKTVKTIDPLKSKRLIQANRPIKQSTLPVFSTSLRNIMKTVIGSLAFKHSKPASKCPHLVCLNKVIKSHEQFGNQRSHQVLKVRKTTFWTC